MQKATFSIMDQSTVGFEAKRSKICQICATVSENYHLNYGVPTCLSCRAFFRRTVQTKVESLECSKSGNCAMIPKSRKNCRKCRLERCYKAGMDPNLVMDEQAKRSRFRNVKSKKRLGSEQSVTEPCKNVGSQSASIVPEHGAPPAWIHNELENSGKPMESDEYQTEVRIRSELVRMLFTWKEQLSNLFLVSPETATALNTSSSLDSHLSKRAIKSHLNGIQNFVINWATTSTGFGSLVENDQTALARENGAMFSALALAKALASEASKPKHWLLLGQKGDSEMQLDLDDLVQRSISSWTRDPKFRTRIHAVNEYEFTQQWQCVIAFSCLLNVQSQAPVSSNTQLQDSTRVLNTLLDVLPLVQCLKWNVTEFLSFLDTLKEFSTFLENLDWNSSEISRFSSKPFTLDHQAQICSMLCDVGNEWRGVNLGSSILKEIVMFGLSVPFSAGFMESSSKRFQERFWRIFEYFPEFRELSENDKRFLILRGSLSAFGVVNFWFDQMSSGQAQLSIIMGHEDKQTLQKENCVLASITPKYYSLSQVLQYVDMEDKEETLELIGKGKQSLVHLIKDWSSFLLVLLFAMFQPAACHDTLARTSAGRLAHRFESILSQTCHQVLLKEHLGQIDHLAEGINNILKLV